MLDSVQPTIDDRDTAALGMAQQQLAIARRVEPKRIFKPRKRRCGIVVGVSRKRMIGALANEAPADRRLAGSLTLALKAVEQGAQIVRVHDVAETVQALKVWRGLRDAALTPRV